MTTQTPNPTIGAAILVGNGPRGWQPGALLFPKPLLLLRSKNSHNALSLPGASTPFHQQEGNALDFLESILAAIHQHLPTAGPGAGKPSFPVAVLAASYEFGAAFSPHEQCFQAADGDDLIASVYIDAYRPDSRGGTERLGYAGTIPAGWMEGAPELASEPWGHDAPAIVAHPHAAVESTPLAPLVSESEFANAIASIRRFLTQGDIYQANLTIPLRGMTRRSPEALMDLAMRRGGAPYAAMMVLPDSTLLTMSPELLLRRRGNTIETRPIKGTRPVPRHLTGIIGAKEELENSEKDRAEHLMIVDLERNDLGRVCEAGSVEVNPFMEIVEHPTVIHMESTVKGKLRAGVKTSEIFEAVYPGGSVTGAPKKRAMEIIRELEKEPRGVYCGAFGWIDATGDLELNLPIRTAEINPDGSMIYHAGCGIVADSDPAEEWRELQTKTAFFQSLLE